jgi:hypothetical protein
MNGMILNSTLEGKQIEAWVLCKPPEKKDI